VIRHAAAFRRIEIASRKSTWQQHARTSRADSGELCGVGVIAKRRISGRDFVSGQIGGLAVGLAEDLWTGLSSADCRRVGEHRAAAQHERQSGRVGHRRRRGEPATTAGAEGGGARLGGPGWTRRPQNVAAHADSW